MSRKRVGALSDRNLTMNTRVKKIQSWFLLSPQDKPNQKIYESRNDRDSSLFTRLLPVA